MRNRIILLLIGFMCYAGMGNAQEDKTEKAVPAIVSDSVEVAAPDSTVQAVLMAADSVGVPEVNGCWIMSSVQAAADQSGKWAIVNMPKLDGIDGCCTTLCKCTQAS